MRKRTIILLSLPFLLALIPEISAIISANTPVPQFTVVQLSNYTLDQSKGTESDVPQWIRNLEGKRVTIIGNEWDPAFASDGSSVQQFALIDPSSYSQRTLPVAQEFIAVNVSPGAKANYFQTPVRVVGILHVKIQRQDGMIKTVLQVDANQVTLPNVKPPVMTRGLIFQSDLIFSQWYC